MRGECYLSSALPGLTESVVTYQPGVTRPLGPPELTTMVTYLANEMRVLGHWPMRGEYHGLTNHN